MSALQLARDALENLMPYESISVEYDGEMLDRCPSCGGQDGVHVGPCAFTQGYIAIAALDSAIAQEPRCPHCDGSGDVHRADGEWLGSCDCEHAAIAQEPAYWITNKGDLYSSEEMAKQYAPNNTLTPLYTTPQPAPELDRLRAINAAMLSALEALVEIIDKAKLINLSRGVELGPTIWYVKASDRLDAARVAIAKATS